jgi:NitT/TauT family transport system substrate-binding protein
MDPMRSNKPGWRTLLAMLVVALVAAACSSDDSGSDTTAAGGDGTETTVAGGETDTTAPAEMEKVRLQLQWFTQAQFAGYFAAVDQGFYADEGLDVEILQGGVDIVPQQVLGAGSAEFALSWVPKALVSREEGIDIVNVGQVFERSGTLEVAWADSGITTPEDWAGKKVGNWGFGNEFELTAAIEKFQVPDVELVQQAFDMSALLNDEVDASEAMIYNEYAQVLETVNPDTGELYQPEDLSVIDFNEVGTAMLQDAVWVTQEYLDANQDTVERFLKASFEGWIWCRDNFDPCVDVVLANAPTLGKSHQQWQLNEINGLIWPSTEGIGVVSQPLWDQTIEVAVSEGILSETPDEGALRTDVAAAANELLASEGVDVTGAGWERQTVELNEGGN